MCEKLLKYSLIFLCLIKINNGILETDEFLRAQSPLYGIAWISTEKNHNTTCTKDLKTFLESLDSKHVWALKVLDASGQPESSFLWGNNLWLGSESACYNTINEKPLEVNHNKIKHFKMTKNHFPPYPLNFLMVRMLHDNILQQHTQMLTEKTIQLGLCLPKSCDEEQVTILVREYWDSGYFNFQKIFNISIEIKQVNSIWMGDSEWLKLPKTITFICIYSLSLLFVIIGTVYDVKIIQPRLINKQQNEQNTFRKNGKNGINTLGMIDNNSTIVDGEKQLDEKENKRETDNVLEEVVRCFSFYSNVKSFVKTKVGYDAIGMVHGFRLFSMFWVISVHAMFYEIDYYDNIPDGFRLAEKVFTQPFNNSTYCVDSFLFLSGFLLSYLFFKTKKKNNVFDLEKSEINLTSKFLEFVSLLMNRFLRLTPPYMIAVITADVIYTWLRSHSLIYNFEMNDENCPKYWWRNLFYINNLFPISEMCLSWSWYLSVDMQFFAISTFILIISTIYFKTAAIMVFALVLTGSFSLGVASYKFGYVPSMDEQFVSLDAIYHLPWQRIGPYAVGLITGYILVIKLNMKLNLNKITKTICWIIFPCVNLYIIFGIWGRNLSVEYSAFFMGFSRTFWGVGLAWFFIACCTNNAGIVNKFLSFKGWVSFSKLTYCAYLINPIFMTLFYGTNDGKKHVSLSSMIFDVFAGLMLTFFLSFWFSMMFESPYIALTKLVLKKSKRESESDEIAERK